MGGKNRGSGESARADSRAYGDMARREEDTKEQIEILRRLRPQDRLRAAFELHEFAWTRIASTLRERSPDLDEEELNAKVRERLSS